VRSGLVKPGRHPVLNPLVFAAALIKRAPGDLSATADARGHHVQAPLVGRVGQSAGWLSGGSGPGRTVSRAGTASPPAWRAPPRRAAPRDRDRPGAPV